MMSVTYSKKVEDGLKRILVTGSTLANHTRVDRQVDEWEECLELSYLRRLPEDSQSRAAKLPPSQPGAAELIPSQPEAVGLPRSYWILESDQPELRHVPLSGVAELPLSLHADELPSSLSGATELK